jgi:hypothetical protein
MLIINQLVGFGAGRSVVGYRYFRLTITRVNAGGEFVQAYNFRPLVGASVYPTDMTSNSAPSPLVASASSEVEAAYRAFDSNPSGTRWRAAVIADGSGYVGTESYVQIDLGAGNGILADAVLLDGTLAHYPKDFTVSGSNDGSAWDVLLSVTGAVYTGAETFAFP